MSNTQITKHIELVAFRTPDGQIFTEEQKANAHFDDLLGEELDGLLKLFNLNITRVDSYRSLLALIAKPDELKKSIKAIHDLLNFDDEL